MLPRLPALRSAGHRAVAEPPPTEGRAAARGWGESLRARPCAPTFREPCARGARAPLNLPGT